VLLVAAAVRASTLVVVGIIFLLCSH
jgi:hypothetical protein